MDARSDALGNYEQEILVRVLQRTASCLIMEIEKHPCEDIVCDDGSQWSSCCQVGFLFKMAILLDASGIFGW